MQVRAYGEHALLVELEAACDVAPAYAGITRLVEAGDLPRPSDVVPAARTVLVDGLGAGSDQDTWRRRLLSELSDRRGASDHAEPSSAGAEVVIGVRYDGADLDLVADSWSCSVDDVVARHQAATFTVAFCGFAPGFAYCTSDPPLPPVRRRADPRTEVPAGSVALAGEYCGVYPRALPGGWQLIGVTDRTLFDPEQTEPALLRPGDTVRFEDRG